MDNVNYTPKMTPFLAQDKNLGDCDNLVLIDVGCSGGIDSIWNAFGDHFEAYAFDPWVPEIDRLKSGVSNSNIHYYPAFVGLPKDHEFLKRKATQIDEIRRHYPYFNPFERTSAAEAQRILTPPAYLQPADSQSGNQFAIETVGIDEFVSKNKLSDVDFIKIDTDGTDFEVAISSEKTINDHDVLGFMVEIHYDSSFYDTDNAFHNVDRWMKQKGFLLYGISTSKYTLSSLPGNFLYPQLAQTVNGRPLQGDAIYLRDAGSPSYEDFWGKSLSPQKIIKLACLYEIFNSPDSAAELIRKYENHFSQIADPRKLLDLLLSGTGNSTSSYADYISRFHEDPTILYPPSKEAQSTSDQIMGLRKQVLDFQAEREKIEQSMIAKNAECIRLEQSKIAEINGYEQKLVQLENSYNQINNELSAIKSSKFYYLYRAARKIKRIISSIFS